VNKQKQTLVGRKLSSFRVNNTPWEKRMMRLKLRKAKRITALYLQELSVNLFSQESSTKKDLALHMKVATGLFDFDIFN